MRRERSDILQPGSMHSRVADASHGIHATGFGDSNLPLPLITCPFISKLQRSCSFIIINKLEVVFYYTVLKPMHDHPTELIKFTNNDRSFFLWENDYTVPPFSSISYFYIFFNLENTIM